MIRAAKQQGLTTRSEVFADRTYQNDGSLTPRSQPGALIENETMAMEQVRMMVQQQKVKTLSGAIIPVDAETICLHGDGAHAVAFAKMIYKQLTQDGIILKQQ
jgi:5-oxoprolinase (ATP-hydrolysing) subunit A